MRSSRKTIQRDHSFFEQLEARQLLATIAWDGGGDGATLTDPANWAGDVLPGPADDATINVVGSPKVTFSSGTFSVHSLSCAEAFSQSGGTLIVAAASDFSGLLNMTGGAMAGPGTITISGAFDWDAGTMTGAGTTIIDTTSIVTMASGGTRVISRIVANNGRINQSNGALQFGGSGTLNNAAGHVYKLTGGATISAIGSGNVFNNAGVINDETTATITITAQFNNSGQLNVYGGVLNIDGGGTNTGTRNIAQGAVLNYRADYTHGAGSNASGSGIMNFNGGAQTISGNWTAHTFLRLLSGTLTGAGNLTTTGPFTWGSGMMTGSGNVTIAAGAQLIIATGAVHTLSRPIVNNGILHYLNGVLNMAGATITNAASGVFAVLPATTISSTAGVNVIDNAGIFRKMGQGTLTLDSVLGGITVNNTGTVDVRNGVLNLNGPVPQVNADTLTAGTWQVYPTASLSLGPVIIVTLGNLAAVNLIGAGAHFNNISSLATNNGAINLGLGGIFQIAPSGGTFVNNGTIDLAPDRWLRIVGNFIQGGSGRVNFSLASANRYSRLITSGGTSALAGTAAFDLVGGFVPTAGLVFNFLSSTGRSGTFDTVLLPTFPNGTAQLNYTASGANISVT